MSKAPEVILDVAHNEDSAKKLQENLNKNYKRHTVAIIGILKDKDVYSLIKPMIDIVDEWYCVTIDSSRGMNAKEIQTRISTLVSKDKIHTHDAMLSASSSAMSRLKNDSRLIVYGSFYTVSEYLSCHRMLNNHSTINSNES